MDRETRTSKYKELREKIHDDVKIDRQSYVEDDAEDDFLSFLPKSHEKPLAENYEDLTGKVELDDALHVVTGEPVGKSLENTRMDILKKIKDDNSQRTKSGSHEDDLKHGHAVSDNASSSFMDKIIAMSPEEDVKEFEAFKKQEDVKTEEVKEVTPEPVEEKPKKVKKEKPKKVKEDKPKKPGFFKKFFEEEDDTDSDGAIDKVERVIMVILVAVFVVLLIALAALILF